MPTAVAIRGVEHITSPSGANHLGGYWPQEPTDNPHGAAMAVLRALQSVVALVPMDNWFGITSSVIEAVNGRYDYMTSQFVGKDTTTPVHELLLRFVVPEIHRAGYDTVTSDNRSELAIYYLSNCGNSGCPCAARTAVPFMDDDGDSDDGDSDSEDYGDEEDDRDSD